MNSWQKEPFGAVFSDITSGNVKTLQSAYLDSGAFPVVDQGQNLIGGYTNDEQALCHADLPVIVFGDHTKALKYVDFPFCMGADGTKILKPRSDTDPKYLYYYLRTLKLPDAGYSRHFKFLKEVLVPLPPLQVQKRIAAILDAAEGLRTKRYSTITKLDALAKSIYIEMFGDRHSNRKGIRKATLGKLIRVKSGEGLVKSEMSEDGPYPVYGGNGINGAHSAYMFEEAQLVIGRVGVYCGAVHVTKPKSWVTDNALYVSEYYEELNQIYLASALKFANLNQYADKAAQPLVSGNRLYPVEILVPPIDDQKSYAAKVERASGLTSHALMGTRKLDDLCESLQQRAYAGELS